MNGFNRAPEVPNVRGNAPFGEDIERRSMLLDEPNGVGAVNRQVTRSSFKITRHFPGLRRSLFRHELFLED